MRTFLTGLALCSLTLAAQTEPAAAQKVVIGYQTDAKPYTVAIANGEFAAATGWDIDYRRFNSGAEILTAIASGDIQMGDAGSSPIAAAASRGLPVRVVYLTSIAGTDEALVVRNDSGIEKPADLRGKRLAAAPVSTDHYQLLATLKQEGIAESAAQVFALPQPEIVAAWHRGDLDGAFVWDPALSELRKTGTVLLTARQVADRGAPIFTAWVVQAAFVRDHPDFLKKFVAVSDQYARSFLDAPAAWRADSDNARILAKFLGGTAQDQADGLAHQAVLPASAQAKADWLTGGVAKILKDTADFLKDQKKITTVLGDYSPFVTDAFVR